MRVIFDVDGTLIQSVAVDAALYDRAFRETFAVALPTTDWSAYRDATDAGIFAEAVERLRLPDGRAAEMQRRFVALLASVATIEPVAGARSILGALQARGISVAVATGGWRAAALQKLRAAEIDLGAVPLVGSDESPRRREIIARAIELLGGDGDVFYVGDGAWDLQASRALGIGFIGVDANGDGHLGVPAVSDFCDVEAFVRMLRR